jgi:hypothetical protein
MTEAVYYQCEVCAWNALVPCPEHARKKPKKPVKKADWPIKNDLEGWAEAIRESGDRHQAEIKEFNRVMGEPHLYVSLENGEGIGYWRINGGIVSYVKWPNGQYNPMSRQTFEGPLIVKLHELLRRPPKTRIPDADVACPLCHKTIPAFQDDIFKDTWRYSIHLSNDVDDCDYSCRPVE